MTVELKPETERLVQEEIRRGQFQSVDEVIVQGVYALRERAKVEAEPASSREPRKSLYELLTEPPFVGCGLEVERQKDYPRPIEL